MNCPKCNSEIRDDSKFCPKCGTKCDNIKSGNLKSNDEHKQDLKIGNTKENFAKNEQTIESDVQKSLEIIELNQNGVVKGIISIIFGIIGAYVFSICLDRMFGGIMLSVFGWVILFVCQTVLEVSQLQRKRLTKPLVHIVNTNLPFLLKI